jgi:hypothetical protein
MNVRSDMLSGFVPYVVYIAVKNSTVFVRSKIWILFSNLVQELLWALFSVLYYTVQAESNRRFKGFVVPDTLLNLNRP